jgi:heme/copper-type cytochrome/quinol oxidase subunit 4
VITVKFINRAMKFVETACLAFIFFAVKLLIFSHVSQYSSQAFFNYRAAAKAFFFL